MSRLLKGIALGWACLLLPTVTLAAPNKAPTASLTAPANGASYVSPATITLNATAADQDGTVTKVDFYWGGTNLIGTDTSAPYTVTWSNVAAGSYALTAKATDDKGATGTSTVVNITVTNTPPTVSLTAPANGATYTAPASIGLSANASDANGTISKVEFFNGASLLATVTSAPYSYNWSNVGAGSYTLTAKATDNGGAATTSAAVNVTVGTANIPPLVALVEPTMCQAYTTDSAIPLTADAFDQDGSIARVEFYRDTTLIGTAQNNAPYQDIRNAYSVVWSGMPVGTFNVTAKAIDNRGTTTVSAPITFTIAAGNTPPTVSITSPANGASFGQGTTVTVTANAADADGSVTRVDFYAGATLIGTKTAAPYTVNWSGMAGGSYSLTAVATDNRNASSTSAPVLVTINPNQPPTVSLTTPQDGASYYAPATIALSANAADADGSISKVEFYQSSTLLTTVTAPPYTYSWTGVPVGSYSITAKAYDNNNASTISAAASVTVAPTLTITYLHNDFLGSPIAATDEAGNIIWRENYRPYGDRMVKAPAANDKRQWYTGKPFDAETGLSYFGARYYDQAIGRFMGVDAVDFQDSNIHSFNRYAYANNNPYRFVDPDGNESQEADEINKEYRRDFKVDATNSAAQNVQQGMSVAGDIAVEGYKWWAGGKVLGAVVGSVGKLFSKEASALKNGHLADSVHPKTGIPFDKNGYPDFSGVAKAEVKITQTGSRAGDFRAANKAAGLKSTPEGHTWHHHQDGTTMQLVPRDIHAQTGHTGGFKPGE